MRNITIKLDDELEEQVGAYKDSLSEDYTHWSTGVRALIILGLEVAKQDQKSPVKKVKRKRRRRNMRYRKGKCDVCGKKSNKLMNYKGKEQCQDCLCPDDDLKDVGEYWTAQKSPAGWSC